MNIALGVSWSHENDNRNPVYGKILNCVANRQTQTPCLGMNIEHFACIVCCCIQCPVSVLCHFGGVSFCWSSGLPNDSLDFFCTINTHTHTMWLNVIHDNGTNWNQRKLSMQRLNGMIGWANARILIMCRIIHFYWKVEELNEASACIVLFVSHNLKCALKGKTKVLLSTALLSPTNDMMANEEWMRRDTRPSISDSCDDDNDNDDVHVLTICKRNVLDYEDFHWMRCA